MTRATWFMNRGQLLKVARSETVLMNTRKKKNKKEFDIIIIRIIYLFNKDLNNNPFNYKQIILCRN